MEINVLWTFSVDSSCLASLKLVRLGSLGYPVTASDSHFVWWSFMSQFAPSGNGRPRNLGHHLGNEWQALCLHFFPGWQWHVLKRSRMHFSFLCCLNFSTYSSIPPPPLWHHCSMNQNSDMRTPKAGPLSAVKKNGPCTLLPPGELRRSSPNHVLLPWKGREWTNVAERTVFKTNPSYLKEIHPFQAVQTQSFEPRPPSSRVRSSIFYTSRRVSRCLQS